MYYLHRYFSVYSPEEFAACPVSLGILQVSILSLSLKVITQEYILERLPITEQLSFCQVEISSFASMGAPAANTDSKLQNLRPASDKRAMSANNSFDSAASSAES